MSDIAERLEKVEKTLERILEKLRNLEELISRLGISSDYVNLVVELTSLYSIPISLALESARRVAEISSRMKLDPISMEIVKVLSTCREMSVSGITRAVKDVRGRASRRTIRERLKLLQGLGILVNTGSRTRPKFVLSTCLQKKR